MSGEIAPRVRRQLRNAGTALSERMRKWGSVLAKFTLVQLIVQALGALAGIIVVRTLAKQDYAYYTIANSTLSALFWLANSGVTFAASAIGGRVFQDRGRLGQVVSSAIKVSKWPALLAMLVVLPTLVWLLLQNGAAPVVIALMSLLLVASMGFQLNAAILIVVARLKGDIRFLQKLDLLSGAARLGLIVAATFVYVDAIIAIMATVIGTALQWLVLKSWSARIIELDSPPDPAMEEEMRRAAKRQWLNEVYFAFYGQISVFLVSIFGTTESVADLGALYRFAIIFAAVTSTMYAVVLPAFSRCQEPRRLRSLYFQICVANAAIAALPVGLVYVAPQPFLWILGAKYAHLEHQLLLVAVNTAISVMASITNGLNQSRAWIIPGWFAVPISIVIQIVLILLIGPTSLERVIWMSILSNLAVTAMNIGAASVFGRRFALASMAATGL